MRRPSARASVRRIEGEDDRRPRRARYPSAASENVLQRPLGETARRRDAATKTRADARTCTRGRERHAALASTERVAREVQRDERGAARGVDR